MYGVIRQLTRLFSRPEPLEFHYDGLNPKTDAFTIELDGGARFELVYNTDSNDPIVLGYIAGYRPNSFITRQLQRFVPPGGTVLDLGAHVGTFSLTAAALGYRVVAVDASPIHIDLLNKSVARNGFGPGRLRVVHGAVGDTTGTVEFHLGGLWGMVAQPGHEPAVVKGTRRVTVPLETGDRLRHKVGCRQVDFMKMDIEGSEVKAVRGLKGLLKRHDAPVIVYECNGLTLPEFGNTTGDLIGQLEEFGYRSYRFEDEKYRPARSGDFQPEAWLDLVALKPRHEKLVGEDIGPPLDLEETIARVVQEAHMPHQVQRDYIARALSTAGVPILVDPKVQAALEKLAQDPVEGVRESAGWWRTRRTHAA